ncbi:unnamed protein product [Vitrella brassicaformis CCMP3155]|uniref:Transmembrane protein n=2 Tax=Vitrella brassicaformis TaxID=1169539 RepID=A0A0G4G4S2_VITBC|nr:unnamed protein product [Vitrella brassicaformis CCMP3155]|eukprot:CEM23412.1 unnamed protein product [Vitrella brassicaformis CCMP3155]
MSNARPTKRPCLLLAAYNGAGEAIEPHTSAAAQRGCTYLALLLGFISVLSACFMSVCGVFLRTDNDGYPFLWAFQWVGRDVVRHCFYFLIFSLPSVPSPDIAWVVQRQRHGLLIVGCLAAFKTTIGLVAFNECIFEIPSSPRADAATATFHRIITIFFLIWECAEYVFILPCLLVPPPRPFFYTAVLLSHLVTAVVTLSAEFGDEKAWVEPMWPFLLLVTPVMCWIDNPQRADRGYRIALVHMLIQGVLILPIAARVSMRLLSGEGWVFVGGVCYVWVQWSVVTCLAKRFLQVLTIRAMGHHMICTALFTFMVYDDVFAALLFTLVPVDAPSLLVLLLAFGCRIIIRDACLPSDIGRLLFDRLSRNVSSAEAWKEIFDEQELYSRHCFVTETIAVTAVGTLLTVEAILVDQLGVGSLTLTRDKTPSDRTALIFVSIASLLVVVCARTLVARIYAAKRRRLAAVKTPPSPSQTNRVMESGNSTERESDLAEREEDGVQDMIIDMKKTSSLDIGFMQYAPPERDPRRQWSQSPVESPLLPSSCALTRSADGGSDSDNDLSVASSRRGVPSTVVKRASSRFSTTIPHRRSSDNVSSVPTRRASDASTSGLTLIPHRRSSETFSVIPSVPSTCLRCHGDHMLDHPFFFPTIEEIEGIDPMLLACHESGPLKSVDDICDDESESSFDDQPSVSPEAQSPAPSEASLPFPFSPPEPVRVSSFTARTRGTIASLRDAVQEADRGWEGGKRRFRPDSRSKPFPPQPRLDETIYMQRRFSLEAFAPQREILRWRRTMSAPSFLSSQADLQTLDQPNADNPLSSASSSFSSPSSSSDDGCEGVRFSVPCSRLQKGLSELRASVDRRNGRAKRCGTAGLRVVTEQPRHFRGSVSEPAPSPSSVSLAAIDVDTKRSEAEFSIPIQLTSSPRFRLSEGDDDGHATTSQDSSAAPDRSLSSWLSWCWLVFLDTVLVKKEDLESGGKRQRLMFLLCATVFGVQAALWVLTVQRFAEEMQMEDNSGLSLSRLDRSA